MTASSITAVLYPVTRSGEPGSAGSPADLVSQPGFRLLIRPVATRHRATRLLVGELTQKVELDLSAMMDCMRLEPAIS
jgi:hypothetical protein